MKVRMCFQGELPTGSTMDEKVNMGTEIFPIRGVDIFHRHGLGCALICLVMTGGQIQLF